MIWPNDYINQVLQGDCLEVMKDIPDKSVDLVLTSPPYDKLRDYKKYSFDFEGIAKELFRIIKFGGIVVWIVGDATINGSETGTSFKQAIYFKEIGFRLHDTMIYHKDGLTFPETNRYYPAFEYMFLFSNRKPKTTNLLRDKKNIWGGSRVKGHQRGKNGELKKRSRDGELLHIFGVRQNVWLYGTGWNKTTKDHEAFQHPAMFPEKLAEDHILSWSNEGDLVLDTFSGSGTTCKMAKIHGRQFIGIEISEKYCQIAKQRIEQTLVNKKLEFK